MNTARLRSNVSVDAYLTGENQSPRRHEYLDGEVYAMSGESAEHSSILINLLTSFRTYLSGADYKLYALGLKVRMEFAGQEIFYSPDLMVVCDPRDKDCYFKKYPKLVLEVLSPSTERLDRFEKRTHYRQLETLEEYVLVEQDFAEVTLYRRANEWRPEVIRGPGSEVRFESLGLLLPMSAIYEGVRS